jgi:hypothetical protein
MPFIGASALAMARMRPGTRGRPGGVDAEVAGNVAARCLRRGQDLASPAGDPGLHPDEAVPASYGELAAPRRRRREVDPPVEGDRVMDGGVQRQPEAFDVEHAGTEHLVVVDDVEVVDPVGKEPGHPAGERPGLRESADAHGQELLDVDQVAELAQLGDAERIWLTVEVEAGNLGQPDAGVELGIGLPGEHLDLVAEVGELTAEMADIDALAAAVGLAPVGQECDTHRLDLSLAPSGMGSDAPSSG